ncbi:MAG: hypothetical protein LBG92_12180 [Prevotellaceae bacterium]|nr:hypothetical protein [Prevotellaceae bacterium]
MAENQYFYKRRSSIAESPESTAQGNALRNKYNRKNAALKWRKLHCLRPVQSWAGRRRYGSQDGALRYCLMVFSLFWDSP